MEGDTRRPLYFNYLHVREPVGGAHVAHDEELLPHQLRVSRHDLGVGALGRPRPRDEGVHQLRHADDGARHRLQFFADGPPARVGDVDAEGDEEGQQGGHEEALRNGDFSEAKLLAPVGPD